MPLVHDGVLFVHGMGDRVQALDAQSGDLLWEYRRQLPQGVSATVKRGMALYRDRLYIGTSDANVIALDAKTGKLVWDTRIGDTQVREGVAGGVLAARGKIMVGTTGTGVGAKPGGPQIVGLDADTGRIAWRVNTIAQPGEPGGDSWNGIPVEQRSGASVWTTGSYEPTTGLAFFGTGNTYDTGPLLPPSNRAGRHQRRALYEHDAGHRSRHGKDRLALPASSRTSSGISTGPSSGRSCELPVRGQMRKLVVTAGKIGIYDAVEAATGRFVFSIDLGLQNIVTAIDPETGKKTIDASRIPGDGTVKLVCPHGAGVKNYRRRRTTRRAGWCSRRSPKRAWTSFRFPAARGAARCRLASTGASVPGRTATASTDGLQAINLETRKTVWSDARPRAADVRRARHRGRRRLRRRVRSLHPRLRRRDREGAVADTAQRREQLDADHLQRRRQAVPGRRHRPGRIPRRELRGAGARAGEPARSRRDAVGVRAAVRARVVRPRNAKQESVDLPRVKRV